MIQIFLTRFTAFLTCSWKNMPRKQLHKVCKVYNCFLRFLFEIIVLKVLTTLNVLTQIEGTSHHSNKKPFVTNHPTGLP